MKVPSSFIIAVLCALSSATPTSTHKPKTQRTVEKPATASDKATLGYATLNGGTSGGSGGNITIVSTLAQFTAAVAENNTAPGIVVVDRMIYGSTKVRIGSNKTIIGLPGAGFIGVGLYFKKQSNLILRNIKSSLVEASHGDGLTIENSTNIWVDHCDFSSDLSKGKDFYDGLIDITHGSDFITISNTYFHNHWKTSLVGHSDRNAAQDTGHLHVTYANNHWNNCGSRGPSVRFGTVHIINSFYENMHSAINARMSAQLLIQSNVFQNVSNAIESQDSSSVGYAVSLDNDLGRGGTNKVAAGNLTAESIPYAYVLLGSGHVASAIPGVAGASLVVEGIPTSGNSSVVVVVVVEGGGNRENLRSVT